MSGSWPPVSRAGDGRPAGFREKGDPLMNRKRVRKPPNQKSIRVWVEHARE
jgi:hypothetical protein